MSMTGLRLIRFILTWRDGCIKLINQGMIVNWKSGVVLGFNRVFWREGIIQGEF